MSKITAKVLSNHSNAPTFCYSVFVASSRHHVELPAITLNCLGQSTTAEAGSVFDDGEQVTSKTEPATQTSPAAAPVSAPATATTTAQLSNRCGKTGVWSRSSCGITPRNKLCEFCACRLRSNIWLLFFSPCSGRAGTIRPRINISYRFYTRKIAIIITNPNPSICLQWAQTLGGAGAKAHCRLVSNL